MFPKVKPNKSLEGKPVDYLPNCVHRELTVSLLKWQQTFSPALRSSGGFWLLPHHWHISGKPGNREAPPWRKGRTATPVVVPQVGWNAETLGAEKGATVGLPQTGTGTGFTFRDSNGLLKHPLPSLLRLPPESIQGSAGDSSYSSSSSSSVHSANACWALLCARHLGCVTVQKR